MSRRWTEREMQYLESRWGLKSASYIGEKLNRSPKAVSLKALKMKLGTMTDNVDGIPMSMLGEMVGKPYSSVRHTWVKLGLKVYKLGKEIAYVKEEDLLAFMKEHPNLWDARECDYYMFYKNKWFLDALENERNGIHARRYHKWSESENARLLYLRDVKGLMFKDIAKDFNLAEKAVYKKYKKLKGK